MITTCTVCQARYQLEDDKVPRRVIRVRCPACSGVFALDGSRLASPDAAAPEAAPTAPTAAPIAAPAPNRIEGLETGFPAPQPPVARPARPAAPEPEPQPAAPSVARTAAAVAEPPAAAAPRRRRAKEEMLARALVSDILVYNRDQRDAALRAGNLVEAMGPEIKKSWELYKEKVGAEVAHGTTHFRDALNDILAEGEKVF
ncbi:MAG: zinc-ribbon domain-containing protein [Candidatus Krumholzibacteriia bacterium]